ncbi:MAG TPA: FecR domain-containing protein [Kofleriaceae bacterium]|nr:FecR domain-containing protein [Kofleriaceae bacterium]
MSDDYLFDRSGPPDPDVAKLEKLLAPLRHDAPLDELRMRRKRRTPWFVLGVALAAAAALVIYFALPAKPTKPSACGGSAGFAFSGVGGDVSCGGAQVAHGVLPVGGQLDTGPHEASLTIADIGSAELGKQTRVRLERTDRERHQLSLERGHMHAKVAAPPRLFAVSTKHTEVVDLGCEYTIDVDDTGAGSICVATGLVELATASRATVVVPEGACATILAGQRPGLPHARDARPELVSAIDAYDRGDPAAFDRLLTLAERRDAITLIALAAIEGDPNPSPKGCVVGRCRSVLERLMELSPPPDAEITVDSALTDPNHFGAWRNDILEIYYGMWGPRAGKKQP